MSMIVIRPASIKSTRARSKRPRPIKPRPNPRDRWPSWTDRVWTTSEPVSQIDLTSFARSTSTRPADRREQADFMSHNHPGSIASAEPTVPTPGQAIWWAGYSIGYQHDLDAVPSAELDEDLALSWWVGRSAGWMARDRDDARIDRLAVVHSEPFGDRDAWPLGGLT